MWPVGLFSRRRYTEGTVPDNVEELDNSVIGPPPASYQPQPTYPSPRESAYPSPRRAPDEATEQVEEADEEFYDDEDSEDRPEPGEREEPRFLPPPPTRIPPRSRRATVMGFAV